jgi:hypothetical protein
MDSTTAEAFPDLYRTILDGIAELERKGHRAEAHQIRLAATAAYSGAWSEMGHRRLSQIAERLRRDLAAPDSISNGSTDTPRRAAPSGPLAMLLRIATFR